MTAVANRAPSAGAGAGVAAATGVYLAALGHLFNDALGNIYPALVPLLAEAMGFGVVSGSLVIQAVRMASAVLQPVFGAAADRRASSLFGPVSLGLAALCTGLLASAGGAAGFVVLAILAGGANGAYHPPSLSLVRSLSGDRPGHFTAVFMVGGSIGRALGPLMVVGAVAWLGLKGIWLLAGPGLALAGVLTWLALRPAPAQVATASAPAAARPAPPPHAAGSTLALVRGRVLPLGLILVVALSRATVTSTVTTFWPLLHGHAVLAVLGSASVIAVMLLSGSVGNLVGGSISDRMAPHRLLALAAIGSAAALGAFALARGLWVYPFAALAGFCSMSTNAVTAVMAQDLLPERVATASGLALGTGNALAAGATALLALAAAAWGGPAAMGLSAGVALLGLPAALMYPAVARRTGSQMRPPMAPRAANP